MADQVDAVSSFPIQSKERHRRDRVEVGNLVAPLVTRIRPPDAKAARTHPEATTRDPTQAAALDHETKRMRGREKCVPVNKRSDRRPAHLNRRSSRSASFRD